MTTMSLPSQPAMTGTASSLPEDPSRNGLSSDEHYGGTAMRSPIPVAHRAFALAAVLVPVTLLPYLFIRRNIHSLRRQVVTLTESDTAARLAMKIHVDQVRMLQNRLQTAEDALSELERQMVGTAKEANVKAELKKVQNGLLDARNTSESQLRALSLHSGQNFADLANFINEAELSTKGLPAQASRIERIRQLAFRMCRI